jgi:NAD(P)-dependent dehydrogenase (short-subunit alcohol dehydrogenase family)
MLDDARREQVNEGSNLCRQLMPVRIDRVDRELDWPIRRKDRDEATCFKVVAQSTTRGPTFPDRSWKRLSPAGVEDLIRSNLSSTFHGSLAALPIMRKQKDGVIINIASIAGRFVSTQPGVGYIAAKHGVVALSHSINMEECRNGIRANALCPGEVATPIIAKRPVPVSDEDKARMLQSEGIGDLIRYIACLPSRVCLNDVLITPTWNRAYISAQDQGF